MKFDFKKTIQVQNKIEFLPFCITDTDGDTLCVNDVKKVAVFKDATKIDYKIEPEFSISDSLYELVKKAMNVLLLDETYQIATNDIVTL